jgi:hypothetical protein
MVLKVYFGGAELTEAVNVELDLIIDTFSLMTFNLPPTLFEEWSQYQFAAIQCYETATLKFQGFVEKITPVNDPLNDLLIIECSDDIKKLERNILSQDKTIGTDFILYEGIAGSTPASTSLQIHSSDGIAPTWILNEYVGKYLIISKKEANTETQEFENGSNGYVGHSSGSSIGSSSVGDYTDVLKTPAASYFKADNSDASSFWLRIGLNAVSYSINKNFPLKNIRFNIATILELKAKGILQISNPRSVYIKLYAGATDTFASAVELYSFKAFRDTYSTRDIDNFTFDKVFNISSIQESLFTKGVSYWEGGFVWIEVTLVDDWQPLDEDRLYWYGLDVELEYEESTYLETNDIITANSTSGVVTCNDSGGNPVNFNTRGVTADDTLMITSTLASAFALVGQGVITPTISLPLSYPTFTEGYGKRYNGLNSFELWTELCKYKDLVFYLDYRNSNTLTAKLRSAFSAETATLTGFKKAEVIVENQAYGLIIIFWKNGYVVLPTANTSPLPYVEIKKDYLTEAEALNYATSLVTKYATDAYAITLTYDQFVDVQVGYEVASITIKGVAYTNQMVRRVIYEQDSALGPFTTTIYLGRGYTPDEEAIGRRLGLLTRKQHIDDAIFSSDTYNPSTATKHSDLQQILPSSTSQYHLTAAEHTLIHDFNPATKEAANANIQSHISNDVITTVANVESVITAELVNGQSIDNAIDSLIDARLSAANATDLTDGNATTLHKHSYNNLDDKPTIPTVEDTPTDGHTTQAASSNSVFDVKTTADAALPKSGGILTGNDYGEMSTRKYIKVEDEGNFKNQYADDWGSVDGQTITGWSISNANVSALVASDTTHSHYVNVVNTVAVNYPAIVKSFYTGDTNTHSYISFWARLNSATAGSGALVEIRDAGNSTNIALIYLYISGQLRIAGNAGSVIVINAGFSVTSWHHYMVDVTKNRTTYFYIDGTLIAVATAGNDYVERLNFEGMATSMVMNLDVDAVYFGDSWLKAWSSMYDGQVADRARWTRYGERGWHYFTWLNNGAYHTIQKTTTGSAICVIRASTGAEIADAGGILAVGAVAKSTPNAKAILIRVQMITNTANSGNIGRFYRYGKTDRSQSLAISAPTVANYNLEFQGVVELDANTDYEAFLQNGASSITTSMYVHILGYMI